MDDRPPALRIVHLAGGLRAFNLGGPQVLVGTGLKCPHLSFATPPYARLFLDLQGLGFDPIGVDLLTNHSRAAIEPPEFETIAQQGGYFGLVGRRAWSDVRNVPAQKTPTILDLSGRFATYHRLLSLRIRQLSEAYHGCLRAQLTDIDGDYELPSDGSLFSNGFQTDVEAAIHAFLADAGGLRDLIAEAIWRLVLREVSTEVTTLATLLKRTKARSADHPLLAQVRSAGANGGWLKVLTELRNSVIHIAPLANTNAFGEMQVRLRKISGNNLASVHYPLLRADGSIPARERPVDFDNEAAAQARLRLYRDYIADSADALLYAREVFRRLVALATEVREAAGLTHEIRVIRSTDLNGSIRFARGFGPPSEATPRGTYEER